jgi:hypothetical protein
VSYSLLFSLLPFCSFARYLDDLSKKMFVYAGHMNDRLVFRDFREPGKLFRADQEISTMKFGLSIGDDAQREGGLGMNWKVVKVDQPEQLLKGLRLPHECGCAIMIDFLFNIQCTEDAGKRTAQLTKQFLTYHFEKELRASRQFMGFYIFPGTLHSFFNMLIAIVCKIVESQLVGVSLLNPVLSSAINENDGSKVLRIAICYKRIVSFDGFMDHMLIPYKVSDIISTFAGEIRTNFDLNSLVVEGITSINDNFSGSVRHLSNRCGIHSLQQSLRHAHSLYVCVR